MVGQGADRAADRLGDRVSGREEGADSACSQVSDVGEEELRGSGAVGADEDVGAVSVGVGDLRESVVQNRDVVRGRVGSGVPGPQPPGHALAGVGQETHQGVEAEAAFVGGCGRLLLGVAGDQRGVDVQDQAGQFLSAGFRRRYAAAGLGRLQPGYFPGLGAGRAQAVQYAFVDAGQQSPGSRCRGDGAEHLALVAQDGQIRDGLAAVSEHHREVGRDPARGVTSTAWPERSQHGGVRAGQSGDIGEISQQPCTGMPDHPRTVGGDMKPGTRTDILHAESAFHLDRQNPSTRFIVPAQKALSRYRP